MKKRKHYKIPSVEHANNRIVWRPYIRKDQRTDDIRVDRKGRIAPPILLGKVSDDPDAIMQAYLKAKATLEKTQTAKLHTLRWIMQQYMSSRQYHDLALNSRKVNERLISILEHPLEINGEIQSLGDLHISDVSKPLFNQIKESRYQKRLDAGRKGSVHTNREISLISTSLSWAVNYIPNLGIDNNPLLGFKKLKEERNKRYVSDEEYALQYEIASEKENSVLPIVFELAYLTAARSCEVISIKVSDCSPEGIYINRTKGSKSNIIEWSTRLRAAYDAAIKRHKHYKILPFDPNLLLNNNGDNLTHSGLNSAMQRLKQEMKSRGLEETYWNLHLLKSKGVSDANNKRIAGHRSEAMREQYNTKIESFKPAK